MPQNDGHTLVARTTLSASELTAIQQLAELCKRYENLRMRWSWDELRQQVNAANNDFLYYADDKLVGYVHLYDDFSGEYELAGMVHPDYRRRGIFQALLRKAREEHADAKRFILVCEEGSGSGQAMLAQLGATLSFAEHEMQLEHFRESSTFDDRLTFKPAEFDDLDVIATILSRSFGQDETIFRKRLEQRFKNPHQRYYIATFGEESVGCEEPVGCLRLDDADGEFGIYSVGVVPDYRGRGYGRQMMEEIIRTVRASSQKTIMLDVDTTNTPAISLYTSCGFRTRATHGYYEISAQKG
ncbi:GNAT family N-acetyltransferase [Ktedonosporobacter rubrisoli]|uniref:GNAT family N-acetyltransferase n=1 Tax=Ktedonosporobacter rubrisoli TaxID=2509675 RepID=A0A4P6JZN2_KTERU|nr:GNAT family N-acetyltransferase [Ktedonosporobacter rubrisoli]QBD81368.1 GNAT family N-acetyltransferase [Ktedonosporobacter rubrisoli]